ncbi:Uu.00g090420.m01.CDS01 [Anthostomella pinea]|uniref:Uu.00g090420.m01.CDS01 n=1 Tax=Anthostomella pinea TaxID=933095 RepID=A0AAI8VNT8_9PEZI|nr:Uu.00g090420.m01.CDS01 [Anthostomella pinea]
MARLTDLSDELIVEIISYLTPHQRASFMNGQPFYHWPEQLDKHNEAIMASIQDLQALSTACRRLYLIATEALYDYIPLSSNAERSEKLISTLDNNEDLTVYVRCVDVDVKRYGGMLQFTSLFWLPNVHTISIRGFDLWEPWEWEDDAHVGASPVQVLRLLECGAHEKPLTQMLSFPKALRELWYEVNQVEWDGHYGDNDAPGFTCAAVERAMANQVGSLEKVVFTRPTPDHEGIGYEDQLDVRQYERLKVLHVNQVFLTSLEPDVPVWEHLPKSLEELEVYYDDMGHIKILEDDADRPDWLFGMLERMAKPDEKGVRGDFTPLLERVRIISLEWHPEMYEESEEEEDDEEDENAAPATAGEPDVEIDESRGVGHPGSTWLPPRELIQKFIRAGVSFSIFLHGQRRYRYTVEGGRGFQDKWEDVLEELGE